MKCPHCSNSVSFINLMGQSLAFAGRGPGDDKLYCTSCRKRLYYSVQPAVIFVGLLLAEFGFFSFGRILLKVSKYGISIYIVLSIMVTGIFSIRLRKTPVKLNIVHQSLIHKINFALFSMLLPVVVVQIGYLYYNLIPEKNNLIKIKDSIIFISYLDDFPDYIALKKQGIKKRYYISAGKQFMKEWRIEEKLIKNMEVTILADKSKNIFYPDDPYRIWEIASNTQTIIPYKAFKQDRSAYAKADNWSMAKITILLVICYMITRHIVRTSAANNNQGT